MIASPGPDTVGDTPPDASSGPVYFVADAHLGIQSESAEESKSRDLVSFLGYLVGRASLLYLVGDIFDFWFEYPWVEPRSNPEVLLAIRELVESGTPVVFLGGNHDYWAGSRFEAMTGAVVHRTPVAAEHFGRRVFVAHGDGLPRGDLGYKILKSIIRSRPAIAAFTLVPPRVGAAIARWASGLSEITEDRINSAAPAMKEFLEDTLTKGYDVAVVGHIHRQMVWEVTGGTAAVVGDWMTQRSVLELAEDGVRAMRWKDGVLTDG